MPPAYRRGDGLQPYKKTEPVVQVSLDAGAFEWLWGIVEAKALTSTIVWHEDYRALVARAQRSFRDAAGGPPETAEPQPVRRIKRRAPQPAPEPAPVKRGIKRRRSS